MPNPSPASIYDLSPIETGGVQNRQGLAFQDHVALSFCLRMLEDDRLTEVWCETQDDITLLWRSKGIILAEFVQAKSNELNQLWSISELCAREGGKEGTSILERSLAYDRCKEKTAFRIVTARPFKAELSPLRLKRGSREREAARLAIEKLQDDFERKIAGYRSSNGATCRQWVERVLLDERHDEASVRDANLVFLRRLLEVRGFVALHDQVEEIYMRLLAEIHEAGGADAHIEPKKKRFSPERFAALLQKVAEAYLRRPSPGGGKVLQEKMENAGLPADTIQQAQEQRRAYRQRSLEPKYQDTKDRPLLDEEVGAVLHGLKARLDTGALRDDGLAFHALCLEELLKFRNSLPAKKRPALADLHGSMYVSADRCLHRFRRITV